MDIERDGPLVRPRDGAWPGRPEASIPPATRRAEASAAAALRC